MRRIGEILVFFPLCIQIITESPLLIKPQGPETNNSFFIQLLSVQAILKFSILSYNYDISVTEMGANGKLDLQKSLLKMMKLA